MVQKSGQLKDADLDFITPTMVRLFSLFLDNPMKQYHEREAVKLTRVSKGSANKILRHLSSLEFLTVESRGRMKLYQLNTADPVVRQFKILRNIFALRKLLDSLRSNSRRIVLFGSCAQGSDVRESDIDLLVVTADEKSAARKRIDEFNAKSERRIAPIIVDANEFVKLKREDRPLYENIDRGIVLWQAE